MRRYNVGDMVAFKDCRDLNIYLVAGKEECGNQYTLLDRGTSDIVHHVKYSELWKAYDIGDEVLNDQGRLGTIYQLDPYSDIVGVVFEFPSKKQLNNPDSYEMLPDGSFVTKVKRQSLKRTGAKKVIKQWTFDFDQSEFEALLQEG